MKERGLGLRETNLLTGLASATSGDADGLNWQRVANKVPHAASGSQLLCNRFQVQP